MGRDDNTGQTGLESIRILGTRIENLPMRESAIAQQQIPMVLRTERENQIGEVRGKYPKPSTAYLQSRIAECQETITRVNMMIAQQGRMISEYTGWVEVMDIRATMLADAEQLPEPHRTEALAKVEKRWPPYDVDALRAQIEQCEDAVLRANEVIAKENASIRELDAVLRQARQRDAELEALGVTPE